jgi:hypothetical protein
VLISSLSIFHEPDLRSTPRKGRFSCLSPVKKSIWSVNQLPVVATSDGPGEGVWVFHRKRARHEWGALDRRCKIKQ